MIKYLASTLLAAIISAPLMAAVTPYPAGFQTQTVATNGTRLYVRVGGKAGGRAAARIRGYG
jgi:hypothetical protein